MIWSGTNLQDRLAWAHPLPSHVHLGSDCVSRRSSRTSYFGTVTLLEFSFFGDEGVETFKFKRRSEEALIVQAGIGRGYSAQMNANANASFFGNLRGKSAGGKDPAGKPARGKASIPVFEDKVVPRQCPMHSTRSFFNSFVVCCCHGGSGGNFLVWLTGEHGQCKLAPASPPHRGRHSAKQIDRDEHGQTRRFSGADLQG